MDNHREKVAPKRVDLTGYHYRFIGNKSRIKYHLSNSSKWEMEYGRVTGEITEHVAQINGEKCFVIKADKQPYLAVLEVFAKASAERYQHNLDERT